MPGVDRRAVLGRQVEGVDDVLHPEWQAVQRAARPRAVERARGFEHPLGLQTGEGVHRRLAQRRALEAVLRQGFGGDLTAREARNEAGRPQLVEPGHFCPSAGGCQT
jgi:hypothetical protein